MKANQSFRRDAILVSAIGLAYFLAHQIAFFFPDSAKVLMAVWPAGGIGLASLLLCQRRLWPAIIAVMFVAGNTANLLSGRPVVCSLGFMTANVLESLACALVITAWRGKSLTLASVKDVDALIFASTVVNACTSIIGAGTAFLTHTASFWNFWQTWWVADGLGILLVTPLIVSWSNFKGVITDFRLSKAVEPAVFTVFWVAATWLSFKPDVVHTIFAPEPYMLFALLAWAALRLGQRWVTLAVVTLAVFVITSKVVATGPLLWGGDTPQTRLLLAQLYLGFTAVTGFLLAASYAEAKSATAGLRESEVNYRTVVDQASDGIFIAGADGHYTDANPRACAMVGYSREEILGLSMKDLLLPEDVSAVPVRFEELNAGHELISERRMRRKDGSVFNAEISAKKLWDGRLQGIVRDITDRKRMQEALAESEKKYRNLFNNAEAGMFRTKADGSEILDFNDKYLEIFGRTREEMQGGSTLAYWADPAEREELLAKVKKDKFVLNFPCTMLNKQGQARDCLASVRLYKDRGILEGSIIDITDIKRAQDALRNADKLESLGVLAGGIAHDFNNLLSGIFGYLDLAREDSEPGSAVRRSIEKALKPFSRAKDLTQQLLTFSKGGAPAKKTGMLGPVLTENTKFALSGSSASCSFDISENLWPCDFDENQLGQVVHNIVLNAVQAMPAGGSITVSGANAEVGPDEIPRLAEGRYVKLSFADTGVGIPQNILPRIFDPFFTTKQKGNGLGLATVYSIVNKHVGTVSAESVQGKGSTFTIHLPASAGAVPTAVAPHAASHKGSGRVLVMDDEDFILDIATAMLTGMGYTVDTAVNGRETIDKFKKAAEAETPFDLVILDLTIPGGMGGKEAIREIRKLKTGADVPVFVASGYAKDPVMANPKEYGFTASICKPFRKTELAKLLNNHLKFEKTK